MLTHFILAITSLPRNKLYNKKILEFIVTIADTVTHWVSSIKLQVKNVIKFLENKCKLLIYIF